MKIFWEKFAAALAKKWVKIWNHFTSNKTASNSITNELSRVDVSETVSADQL